MFVQYPQETACLAPEVIHQHAYENSRFLRGAVIDEFRLPDSVPQQAEEGAAPLRSLHLSAASFICSTW